MKVTFDKNWIHTVTIQGEFTGPYFNLDISPAGAYELLLALEAVRTELIDLATNYYDCTECGQTHHNDVKICPLLSHREADLLEFEGFVREKLSHGEEVLDLPDFDTFCQELDQDQRPEGSAF